MVLESWSSEQSSYKDLVTCFQGESLLKKNYYTQSYFSAPAILKSKWPIQTSLHSLQARHKVLRSSLFVHPNDGALLWPDGLEHRLVDYGSHLTAATFAHALHFTCFVLGCYYSSQYNSDQLGTLSSIDQNIHPMASRKLDSSVIVLPVWRGIYTHDSFCLRSYNNLSTKLSPSTGAQRIPADAKQFENLFSSQWRHVGHGLWERANICPHSLSQHSLLLSFKIKTNFSIFFVPGN